MLGFLVAIAAGYATPMIETAAAKPVAAAMGRFFTVEPGETRLIAFMLALLGAGVVASLLESGNAFWIVLGTAIGYFGTRLVAAGKSAVDTRRNS